MDNMIRVQVTDREGQVHELDAPTDMGMNMMELCKSAELPVEGTCGGMAMCASCHMYVEAITTCRRSQTMRRTCWTRRFSWKTTAAWGAKFTSVMTSMA